MTIHSKGVFFTSGVLYTPTNEESDALRLMIVPCILTKKQLISLDATLGKKTQFVLKENKPRQLPMNLDNLYTCVLLLNELYIKPLLSQYHRLRKNLVKSGRVRCFSAPMYKFMHQHITHIHTMNFKSCNDILDILHNRRLPGKHLQTLEYHVEKYHNMMTSTCKKNKMCNDIYIFEMWSEIIRMCQDL